MGQHRPWPGNSEAMAGQGRGRAGLHGGVGKAQWWRYDGVEPSAAGGDHGYRRCWVEEMRPWEARMGGEIERERERGDERDCERN